MWISAQSMMGAPEHVAYEVFDQAAVRVWLDNGGFGVGSDQTWQAIVGGTYHFENGVELALEYRALAFDYEEGAG